MAEIEAAIEQDAQQVFSADDDALGGGAADDGVLDDDTSEDGDKPGGAGGADPLGLANHNHDLSTIEPYPEFGEVPDGKYIAQIIKFAFGETKETGITFLNWQLKIIGGDYNGTIVTRRNYWHSPGAKKMLVTDLSRCGLNLTDMRQLYDLDKLIGMQLAIQAVTKASKDG
jgi:hypothetical protein